MHSHCGYWSSEENIVHDGTVVNKSTLHYHRQFMHWAQCTVWAQYNKTAHVEQYSYSKRGPILLLRFRFMNSQKQAFVEMG